MGAQVWLVLEGRGGPDENPWTPRRPTVHCSADAANKAAIKEFARYLQDPATHSILI